MDFKERFKGRTSTITRGGIESVISNSTTPIKKEFLHSTSPSPLPHLTSAATIILDQTPQARQKPLLSLNSFSGHKSNSSNFLSSFDRTTPKAQTLTSATQMESPLIRQSQPIYSKPLHPLSREMDPRVGGNFRESPDSFLVREHKASSMDPMRRSKDRKSVGIYSMNQGEEKPLHQQTSNLVLSKNQLHKIHFEQLASMNKQRLSQEVGKNLVSAHPYFNSPIQDEGESPKHYNQYPLERTGSYSPVKIIRSPSPYLFREEEMRRGSPFREFPQQERASLNYKNGEGSQVLVLNQVQYQAPKNLRESFRGRISENIQEDNTPRKMKTRMIRNPNVENSNAAKLQSLSQIITRKSKSMTKGPDRQF